MYVFATWVSCLKIEESTNEIKFIGCVISKFRKEKDVIDEFVKLSPNIFESENKISIKLTTVYVPESHLSRWSGKLLNKSDIEKYEKEYEMFQNLEIVENASVN